MKVLVVGGAGYIGSHVTQTLLENNCECVILDNLSSGNLSSVPQEVPFRHADLLNPYSLERVLREFRFDAMVHLAARKAAGESMQDPVKYTMENIQGTLNLMHAAMEQGIENVVFSSSAAVYGNPQYAPIDEKHPCQPENYYGYTKLQMEGYLDWYARLKGLRYVALRYFNAAGYDPKGRVFGLEKSPANLLPVVMEVAAGWRPKLQVFGDDYETPDGTGVRDYVHVTDLAQAHLLALQHLQKTGESLTVNLGSESGLSVLEIWEMAQKVSGKSIPYEVTPRRAGDPGRLVASSDLAREKLGWQAQLSDARTLVSTTWDAYQKSIAKESK